jgi:DNA-binding IscR family transcriptional regulator
MNGGYFLARPPEQITLGEVVRAVDEGIFAQQKGARTGGAAGSVLVRVWNEANAAAAELLDTSSLGDVMRRCKREPINYQI